MMDDERPHAERRELAETGGEPGSGNSRNAGHNSQQRAETQREIPSIDDLLKQLLLLNSAIIMGAISARDAALINRNIKAVLDVQLRRSSREDGPLEQEALAERVRRDPGLLELLSPFLSPQQVEELMRGFMDDGPDGSA